MPNTNRMTPLLHRKEFQFMTPLPFSANTAMFMIADSSGLFNISMAIQSATQQFLYHHDEDAYVQIPSGALAGAFASFFGSLPFEGAPKFYAASASSAAFFFFKASSSSCFKCSTNISISFYLNTSILFSKQNSGIFKSFES